MRNIKLSNEQVYHIYNRGSDKRIICADDGDYERLVASLIVFNDIKPLAGKEFRFPSRQADNRLVNIIAYCIMPNHFHLLLEQLVDGGITRFIQRFNTSYTMYFNKKHERNGVLFQGVFKRSHVDADNRLVELSMYIHANPAKLLSLSGKGMAEVRRVLPIYRWSSLPEYMGKGKGVSAINNSSLVLGNFSSADAYLDYVVARIVAPYHPTSIP